MFLRYGSGFILIMVLTCCAPKTPAADSSPSGSGTRGSRQEQIGSAITPVHPVIPASTASAGRDTIYPEEWPEETDTDSLKKGPETIPPPQKPERYLETISAYCRKYRGKEALADNIYAYGTSGKKLCVSLMKNTAAFREEFRRKILDYPLTDFGSEYRPVIRSEKGCDTCGAVLSVAPGHYPATAEQVRVKLENLSPDTLSLGEDYSVAFFNGRNWVSLCGNPIVNSILILLVPGGTYEFTAYLEPRVNENKPGLYRIYKEAASGKTGKKFMLTAPFELK